MTTGEESTPSLSHIGDDGRARMVDVGSKPITERSATAEGFVRVSTNLAGAIRANTLAKGDLLLLARVAGIQGAKRTADLIPLCHPLQLDSVDVEAVLEPGKVRITATARAHGRTGVEMEALTAVCVAALTVIDMGKSIDKSMVVEGVRVLSKRGGRTGEYAAPDRDPSP